MIYIYTHSHGRERNVGTGIVYAHILSTLISILSKFIAENRAENTLGIRWKKCDC